MSPTDDYYRNGYAHLGQFLPVEVARGIIAKLQSDLADQVGAVAMAAGDAVLYQGVHHHHGRVTPNPNRWSAHLFLHWVERNGAYADYAFDGQRPPAEVAL